MSDNRTNTENADCFVQGLVEMYKFRPFTDVLLIVGLPANLLLLLALMKKAKVTNAFYYQAVIIMNDELLLANSAISAIGKAFAHFVNETNQYGTYPTEVFQRDYSFYYNCVNVVFFNIYFTATPFLLLNICIERNVGMYAPFRFAVRPTARKRLLILLCFIDYLFAFCVNCYQFVGFYVAVGCPNATDTSCRAMQVAEWFNKHLGPVTSWIKFSSVSIGLCLIYALNATFFRKYYLSSKARRSVRGESVQTGDRPFGTKSSGNNKILAGMLIAQTVIVSASQICILAKLYFENGVPYNGYEDYQCVIFKLNAAMAVLFYLGPATNIFVYGFVSSSFRRFMFDLVTIDYLTYLRRKLDLLFGKGRNNPD